MGHRSLRPVTEGLALAPMRPHPVALPLAIFGVSPPGLYRLAQPFADVAVAMAEGHQSGQLLRVWPRPPVLQHGCVERIQLGSREIFAAVDVDWRRETRPAQGGCLGCSGVALANSQRKRDENGRQGSPLKMRE